MTVPFVIKMKKNSFFTFTLLLCIFSSIQLSAQEWKTAKEEDQITAYTKIRDKGLKEVKVQTEINEPLDKLVNFITDYDNPTEWKHSTRSSKVVSRASANDFKVYYIIATPWPLKDRDFYADVRVTCRNNGNACEINFTPDNTHQKHGSKVRMTEFETRWILTRLDEERTKVELYSYGDPVGVNAAFVNMFIVDTPFKTVKNLKSDIISYTQNKPLPTK